MGRSNFFVKVWEWRAKNIIPIFGQYFHPSEIINMDPTVPIITTFHISSFNLFPDLKKFKFIFEIFAKN